MQIYEAGVVPRLMRLLQNDEPLLVQRGAGVLANLGISSRLRSHIANAGGIFFLLDVMRHQDPTSIANGASALRNLSASEKLKPLILQANAIMLLLQLLQHTNTVSNRLLLRVKKLNSEEIFNSFTPL